MKKALITIIFLVLFSGCNSSSNTPSSSDLIVNNDTTNNDRQGAGLDKKGDNVELLIKEIEDRHLAAIEKINKDFDFNLSLADEKVDVSAILNDPNNLKNIKELTKVRDSYEQGRKLYINCFEDVNKEIELLRAELNTLKNNNELKEAQMSTIGFELVKNWGEEDQINLIKVTDNYFEAQSSFINFFINNNESFSIINGTIQFKSKAVMSKYRAIRDAIVSTKKKLNEFISNKYVDVNKNSIFNNI